MGWPYRGVKRRAKFWEHRPDRPEKFSKIPQHSPPHPCADFPRTHHAYGKHVPCAVLAHIRKIYEVSPTHNAILGYVFGQLHIAIVPISQFCFSFNNLTGFRIQSRIRMLKSTISKLPKNPKTSKATLWLVIKSFGSWSLVSHEQANGFCPVRITSAWRSHWLWWSTLWHLNPFNFPFESFLWVFLRWKVKSRIWRK